MSLKENKHYFNCPAGATFSERSLRKSVVPKKLNACTKNKNFLPTTETLRHGVFKFFLCVFASSWFKSFLVSACPS